MGITQIFSQIWKLRWFILASSLICGLTALGTSRFLPKRYAGTAEVSMDSRLNSEERSYSVSNKQIDTYVRSQAELVKDYRVTGRVVDALNWTSSNELAQQYNASGKNTGLDFRSWLASRISGNISLQFQEGSAGFVIVYAGFDPQDSKMMAGMVRDAFIQYLLDRRRDDARDQVGFVDQRKTALESQIRALEKESADFSKRTGVMLNQDGVALAEIRLRNATSAFVPAQTKNLVAPVLSPERKNLASIEGQIAALSKTLGPNHPQLQSLIKERDALRQSIATFESTQPKPAANPAAGEPSLDKIRAEYLAKTDDIATAKRYYTQLRALQEEYRGLQQSASNAQFDTGTIQSGAQADNEPTATGNVYYPNTSFAIPAAFGMGALLAILVGLFYSLLNLQVRSVKDLEMLDIPTFKRQPAE
ncbi:Wzz/FepE/Etk N-terminal domain-containing protein [Erythrobacter sp. LQ02-29]|uniref:Wzz/FepE/Etk N-terminal domain-containing protein n=1 Tax=Erythrobacter sp. LQ02-29 TaxID=2920384 RepID=UPI001F4EACC3|nr:Wzz/FepE/Etk N-terminal domain-containing protein [Erythrobacter sp. LQ02-29]MCP9222058.1 Wzz/FepE/Etk N-terminal domain-containing protein [Erythrobacter sp. LQ02-29]